MKSLPSFRRGLASRWSFLLSLVGAIVFVSCISEGGGESVDTHRIATAEKLWQSKKPNRFSYTLRRSCFCIEEYTGPFLVQATSDSVVQVQRIDSRYPETSTGQVTYDTVIVLTQVQSYSIDTAFATAYRAFGQDHETEKAKFNAEYGYPESLETDEGRNVADGNWGQYITEFQKL